MKPRIWLLLAAMLLITTGVFAQNPQSVADGSTAQAGLNFYNNPASGLTHTQGNQAVTVQNSGVPSITTLPTGQVGFNNTAPAVGVDSRAGLFRVRALATPGAPTVAGVGTTGASTVTYYIVANAGDGTKSLAGSTTSTTTANATLSATNYNTVSGTAPAGTVTVDIIRSAGGPSQGSIALSQAVTGAGGASPTYTINDTGLAASAYTNPARNGTADLLVDGNTVLGVAGGSTGTSSAGAITLQGQQGVITTESLSTAAGSTYAFTLTNNLVTAASNVFVQVGLSSSTQGMPYVQKVAPGAGTVTITIINMSMTSPAGAAFNGSLRIQFLIL